MKTIGILFVTVILSFSSLKGQIENLTWNYPLKPGVKAWDDIESYDERLKTYNIPEKIVKRMSTTNLVETCLNYPELRLIMTRNSLQLGYDYISSIFNGFAELESRPDAGKQLLKAYMKYDPKKITSCKTPLEKGGFVFNLVYLELILSQTRILAGLEKDDKIKFIQYATDCYKQKDLLSNDYSLFGLSTTALVLGRFLDVEQDNELIQSKSIDVQLQNFLDHAYPLEKQRMDAIFENAKNHLKRLSHE